MIFFHDIPDSEFEPLFWVLADEDGELYGLLDAWTGIPVDPGSIDEDIYDILRDEAVKDNGIGYALCMPFMAMEIKARCGVDIVRTRCDARDTWRTAIRKGLEQTWEEWAAERRQREGSHRPATPATAN